MSSATRTAWPTPHRWPSPKSPALSTTRCSSTAPPASARPTSCTPSAIGAWASHHRVLYATSEQFTNEFVESIRQGRTEEFRAKYRYLDILLIDDIQFLAGKERTQEEFFYTFNDLHSASSQIVISSDRSPRLISLLEDRLRSRFEWGLIADIQPPVLETRLAILRAKSIEQSVDLPATSCTSSPSVRKHNIRELEGSFNRVVAYARLLRADITLDIALAGPSATVPPRAHVSQPRRGHQGRGRVL